MNLKKENIEALRNGLPNLERHINNIKKFGLEITVAINHFITDTDKEVKIIEEHCSKLGVKAIVCMHWAKGGEGAKELANHVVELCQKAKKRISNYYIPMMSVFGRK